MIKSEKVSSGLFVSRSESSLTGLCDKAGPQLIQSLGFKLKMIFRSQR